jgi:2-methylcitrate dehydratase PrpD
MEITKDLVSFCYKLSFEQLSSDVIERTKYFALDYIGVLLRGSQEESSKAMLRFIKGNGYKNDGGVVVGTTSKVPYQYAALSNGTAAHALELDDVNNEASLHPAVAIFPAVFAACEMANKTGREFIEGVTLGYEVMIRLGKALNPKVHYARGFHPTGTCGTFGATVAVAKILGLTEKEMLNALGLAGSQAAGSMEFLTEGTWVKRMHPGWAAHNGIIASLLARNGFTGPSTIIEGKSGFLHAYSDNADVSKVLEDIGSNFEIMKTSIKPHACCRYMQAPIDAILKIKKENNIESNDIEKVTLGILEAGFGIIASPIEKKRNPKTSYEAQFSMPYGAAAAILFGQITLDEFTEEKLNNQEIKDLMKKVYCVKDPDLDREYPKHWPATAEIKTKNGRKFSARIDYPKGDPENPLTWEELIDKFKGLTKNLYSPEKQGKIIEEVREIEDIKDLKSWDPTLLQDINL